MTAEIAVMNKTAVALAADSKVTITGVRGSKTYDTVNKLFTLSKIHPVGIMIYGNADFMDYPWETLIKIYRQENGWQNKDYISEWAKDFISFLRGIGVITKSSKEDNIRHIVRSWYGEIIDEAEATASVEGVEIGSDEFSDILKEILDDKLVEVFENEPWADEDYAGRFVKKYGKLVDEITEKTFGHFSDEDVKEKADRFISSTLFFEHASPQASGIVVTGFGAKEYFPTLFQYQTDGYVGDRLKVFKVNEVDITRKMDGCIQAFAQGEMVQRFMEGVDHDLGQLLFNAMHEMLANSCNEVLEKYGQKRFKANSVREDIAKAVGAAMENLGEAFYKYRKLNLAGPVVRMVALLPKDELGHLAESLVALTSLKRRVSSEAETVGGPIDVAVISKGDGFVWIKRKFYFPADINPQFPRTYLRQAEALAHVGTITKDGPSGVRKARPRVSTKGLAKQPTSADKSRTGRVADGKQRRGGVQGSSERAEDDLA